MSHDVIDNRDKKLIDELARRFPNSETAKFAVGYFFYRAWNPCVNSFITCVNFAC